MVTPPSSVSSSMLLGVVALEGRQQHGRDWNSPRVGVLREQHAERDLLILSSRAPRARPRGRRCLTAVKPTEEPTEMQVAFLRRAEVTEVLPSLRRSFVPRKLRGIEVELLRCSPVAERDGPGWAPPIRAIVANIGRQSPPSSEPTSTTLRLRALVDDALNSAVYGAKRRCRSGLHREAEASPVLAVARPADCPEVGLLCIQPAVVAPPRCTLDRHGTQMQKALHKQMTGRRPAHL